MTDKRKRQTRLVRFLALVVVTVVVAACAAFPWFGVDDPTCADWRTKSAGERTGIAGEIIEADALIGAVRVAHADPDASPPQAAELAAASITKTCVVKGWDEAIRIRGVAQEIYEPYSH